MSNYIIDTDCRYCGDKFELKTDALTDPQFFGWWMEVTNHRAACSILHRSEILSRGLNHTGRLHMGVEG